MRTWTWFIAAVLIVVVTAIALRLGTHVLHRGNTFDEQYIRVPIEDLLHKGWSVKTAIDFKESKGPAFIWPYAMLGEVVGSELNDLRLITVLFFVAGVVPLLLICRLCGIDGPKLLVVAGFYALIPQNAALGQLLMSEPSFVFGGLCLMLAFVWGFGESSGTERRILGPILFGLVLSMLLHNRVHAVAFAGAAALVAFDRDGWRSWPWWLACLLAGLSRVPLWIRWGGLVSPEYAELHSLGFRLDSLTYLAAALSPYLGLLLWTALTSPQARSYRWLIALGGAAGLILTLIAPVHLDRTLFLEIEGESGARFIYQGLAASLARTVHDQTAQTIIIGVMAVIGLAGLGALAAIAFSQSVLQRAGQVHRLQLWTFLSGWCIYMFTQGYVFDRFAMAWAVLMPMIWTVSLPRWLRLLQMIALLGVLIIQIRTYLM